MRSSKGRRLLAQWFLPEPDDDAPDLELGPPPLELSWGLRAYTIVRLSAALLAVLVHAAMGVVTGATIWWVIVALSVVHTFIAIPLGTTLARRHPIHTLIADGGAMLVATLVLGDPVVLVFWTPMLLLSTLVYLGGRAGQLGVLYAAGMIAVVFGARHLGIIDTVLDADTVRMYALLSWVSLGTVAFLYLYAVGGAVRRKDRTLAAAQLEMGRARRDADMNAAQLQALFDNSPIGLTLQAPDGSFLFANGRTLEILNVSAEELGDRGVVAVMPPDRLDEIEAAVRRCRENGLPFRLEYPIRPPGAGVRWVRHVGYTIELEEGVGFVSALEDLTAERAATERSRRFAAALEATTDLVVIWDQSGRILHANRAFQTFWESGGDPAGRLLADVVGSLNAEEWVRSGGTAESGAQEVLVKRPDGAAVDMSVLVHRSDADEESGVVYSAAIRDITEVSEARRQLEGLLASKDQFIASVSHELRTPLTAVMGLAAELAGDLDRYGRDDIVEFTRMIAEQSADLAALVEDLLTAARADAGVLTVSPKPVDLAVVVREALGSTPPHLRDRATVDLEDGLVAEVDPTRTRQIVRNLLTNADRYGGPQVRLVAHRKGDRAVVEVSDNGEPIPHEARDVMFEAYGRAHSRIGTPDSVGLGLTVSRRLARMMGGDVVYHHDGTWGRFTVSFPAVM